nr:hypothetical protein [Allomuricauda sp.]
MHYFSILWALFCAALIIGYPVYLYHQSMLLLKKSKKSAAIKASHKLELLSFDIRDQLPGWSVSLEVPQITEDVLGHCPILFYLETEETFLKLPVNNQALGYTAEVYKNTGKVYLTFKCLKDSVSNFHVPCWHATHLKILIIKPRLLGSLAPQSNTSYKTLVHQTLQAAKINLSQYGEVLSYFEQYGIAPLNNPQVQELPSVSGKLGSLAS